MERKYIIDSKDLEEFILLQTLRSTWHHLTKIVGLLYLYLTSGKTEPAMKRQVAVGAPAVAGLF